MIYVISLACDMLATRSIVAAGDDLKLMLDNLHMVGSISGRQVDRIWNAEVEDWDENEIFCGISPFIDDDDDEYNYIFVKRFENNQI